VGGVRAAICRSLAVARDPAAPSVHRVCSAWSEGRAHTATRRRAKRGQLRRVVAHVGGARQARTRAGRSCSEAGRRLISGGGGWGREPPRPNPPTDTHPGGRVCRRARRRARRRTCRRPAATPVAASVATPVATPVAAPVAERIAATVAATVTAPVTASAAAPPSPERDRRDERDGAGTTRARSRSRAARAHLSLPAAFVPPAPPPAAPALSAPMPLCVLSGACE